MNEKIETTKKFIKTHFTQEIENITIVTENQILRLLNELSAIRNAESDESEQTTKIKLQLEYSMTLRRALNPLKMITSLLLAITDPNIEEITRKISILYGFGNENIGNISQSFSAIFQRFFTHKFSDFS